MAKKQQIQLFEDKKVRVAWDDQEEKWYFSIVDVCGVLTDQPDYDGAKNYWKVPIKSFFPVIFRMPKKRL